jgi:AraC-like DNA-binding protein
MAIFMDRHDVSDNVTAEDVAQLHSQDLKIQQKFDCRGLTYWFDEKRKTAFCLIEAPNGEAIQNMHNLAHGQVPHWVIEVDPRIVESFLGRIEDPEKAQNAELNIINDPAFRTIMVVTLKGFYLTKDVSIGLNSLFSAINASIAGLINDFNGRIVKQNEDTFLVSFDSVSNAVSCAIGMQSGFKRLTNVNENKKIDLKIGLSAGVPVTDKNSFFEETIKSAERMCNVARACIVVSSEVRDLYKSENHNTFIKEEQIYALTLQDEKFLNILMDFTEQTWRNTELKVDDFSKPLGLSKSQLYRKMTWLFEKSPNTFIKEYRLSRALKLLTRQTENISEVAYETGFSSPSYFSKCFQKKYDFLPSDYLQTIGQ